MQMMSKKSKKNDGTKPEDYKAALNGLQIELALGTCVA